MATANRTGSGYLEKLTWYLGHHAHTVWDTFSADQQKKMVQKDLSAGTSVALLLVSLITAGLVLSIVTVLAVLLTT
jgi:hypothetical protein